MKTLLRTFVILSFFITLGAHAQDPLIGNGNDLLRRCTPILNVLDSDLPLKSVDQTDAYFCMGYLQGVEAAYSVSIAIVRMSNHSEIRDQYYPCLPDASITNGQTLRIVIKWAREHPESLHNNAEIIVLSAMRDAFRCSGTAKP